MLVRPQNYTKMLRNLTFVVQFAYFLFFEQLFEKLWETFRKSRATCGKP